jgi:hypothetical protein
VRPKRLPFPLVGEDSDECLVEEIAAEGLGGRRHAFNVFCSLLFPGLKVSARAWGKVIDHRERQVILDPNP